MGMLYLHEFAHMHANVLESLSGDLPAGAFRESFPGDNDDATGITSASTPATTKRKQDQKKRGDAMLEYFTESKNYYSDSRTESKKKTKTLERYSEHRSHDMGILFIQQQRDRRREFFERLLRTSQVDGKKELKKRYEQYKNNKDKEKETVESDDSSVDSFASSVDSCASSFEEIMEIDAIIASKYKAIGNVE